MLSSRVSQENIHNIYTIGRTIGKGRYGDVKIAERKNIPFRKFAIKQIDKSKVKKDIRSLILEFEILKMVDHPNIVKYYETYIDEKYIYLVMEYIDGGELFEKIAAQKN